MGGGVEWKADSELYPKQRGSYCVFIEVHKCHSLLMSLRWSLTAV